MTSLQHLNNLSVLCCIFLLTISCGKKNSGTHDDDKGISRQILGTPQSYTLEDEQCTVSTPGKLAPQSVYLWQSDDAYSTQQNLDNFYLDQGVKSKNIAGIVYGTKLDSNITVKCNLVDVGINSTGVECKEGKPKTKTIAIGKELQLCRPSGTYHSNSLEGVSLSAAFNIDTAYTFYSNIAGAKKAAPATIFALPLIQKIYTYELPPEFTQEQRERVKKNLADEIIDYMTDNASFTLGDEEDGTKAPIFLIYPDSKEHATEAFGKMKLWNSSLVLSHEFGHYLLYLHSTGKLKTQVSTLIQNKNKIFKSIIAEKSASAQLSQLTNVLKEIANKPADPSKTTKFSDFTGNSSQNDVLAHGVGSNASESETSSVTGSKALAALDEAIGDLFGYYATGMKIDYTKNMGCLDTDRDVSSSTFKDGTLKKLDLSSFLVFVGLNSSETTNSSDICAKDFKDEHIVGAILAYGFDQLFSLSVATVPTTERPTQKAQLLLAFIEHFATAIDEAHVDFGSSDASKEQSAMLLRLAAESAQKVATNSNLNSADLELQITKQNEIKSAVFPYLTKQ